MTTALVIVDIQNDYFPGGRMPLHEIERAAENARQLLEHFRVDRPADVSHSAHLGRRLGAVLRGRDAGRGHSRIGRPAAGRAGRGEALPEQLPRVGAAWTNCDEPARTDLTICGAMSHMCIDATTRAAADLGFNCLVAHDACATRDVEFEGKKVAAGDVHAAYMSALGFAYAKVMTTADALKIGNTIISANHR